MSFEQVLLVFTFINVLLSIAASATVLLATYHPRGRIGRIVFRSTFGDGSEELLALKATERSTLRTGDAVVLTQGDVALMRRDIETIKEGLAHIRAARDRTADEGKIRADDDKIRGDENKDLQLRILAALESIRDREPGPIHRRRQHRRRRT
jgi:hypothetical protein